jgi:hypothetical protein
LVYGDLATDISLDWIPDVRREFPRSTVITLQSLGPLLLSSTEPRCLADIRRTFVADPDARLDVATCERQRPLIRFVAE